MKVMDQFWWVLILVMKGVIYVVVLFMVFVWMEVIIRFRGFGGLMFVVNLFEDCNILERCCMLKLYMGILGI